MTADHDVNVQNPETRRYFKTITGLPTTSSAGVSIHPIVEKRMRAASEGRPASAVIREILHHYFTAEKSQLVATMRGTPWAKAIAGQPRQRPTSGVVNVNQECMEKLIDKASKTPDARWNAPGKMLSVGGLITRIVNGLFLHPEDAAIVQSYTRGRPRVEVKAKPDVLNVQLVGTTRHKLNELLNGHQVSASFFVSLLVEDFANKTNKARALLALDPFSQPARRSAKAEAMLSAPPERTAAQLLEQEKQAIIQMHTPLVEPTKAPLQTDDELTASMNDLMVQAKANSNTQLYPLSPAEIKAKAELAAFVERGEKEFGFAAPLTPAGLPTPQPTADNAALTPPDEPVTHSRRFMVYWNGQHMTANRCASEIECDPAFAAGVDKPVRSDQPYYDPVEEMMAAHVAARAQVST